MATDVKYKDIYLNINSRSLEIDEKKYERKVEELRSLINISSGIDRELLDYNLNLLVKQFDDYNSVKHLSKKELMRRRRDEIGDLLDDKHHALIRNNLLVNRHRFLYDVDLSDKLDVVIAYTFNVPVSIVRNKLRLLCNKYDISLEFMSRALLCHDDLYYIDSAIPFKELWSIIPEIREFVEDILKKKLDNKTSLMDNINSTKYSEIIRCDNESEELITAFTLKLLLGASEIIKTCLEEFETEKRRMGTASMIYSQYLCGFVVGYEHESDCKFSLYTEAGDIVIEGQSI